MHTHSKEFLQSLTPQKALEVLKQGNYRFVENLKTNRDLLQQVNDTANGQFPFAAVLSCMDSRTSAELIFDQGLGTIFSIRIAGNVVNDDTLGSMEYAVKAVGSKLIVVLGHTRCGAIKGACDNVDMGHLTSLLDKIKPSVQKIGGSGQASVDPEKVAEANVEHSIDEILERSAIIKKLYEDGQIGIVGGMYSVESGRVHFSRELFSEAAAPKAEMAAN